MSCSPSLDRRRVVGLADFAVSDHPEGVLSTYSLGSCLGVAAYDPVRRAGGILHLMLPDSAIAPEKAAARPGMFVDTGLPALLKALQPLNVAVGRLLVYVAGGSQVMDTTGFFSIGKRNYEALLALLPRYDLRVHAADVGGMVNRTMHLRIGTGEVWLKTSGNSEPTLLCKR